MSLEKFQDNINQLYTLAQKFTKKVIFLSLTKVNESKTTPIPWNKKISYYMKYVTAYNNVIKNFCMQNNVFFIDVFDLLTLDDLEDGLHPNTQGHEKIYNKVTDFLLDNKIV